MPVWRRAPLEFGMVLTETQKGSTASPKSEPPAATDCTPFWRTLHPWLLVPQCWHHAAALSCNGLGLPLAICRLRWLQPSQQRWRPPSPFAAAVLWSCTRLLAPWRGASSPAPAPSPTLPPSSRKRKLVAYAAILIT